MQIPPEVIFKDIDRSTWVEEYVAERLAHLEKFAQNITSCHVTLSRESSQRKANRYTVMVEVRLPGHKDLAVKKHKEILDMQTQLPAVINAAFGALEKQLKKTQALRRHEEKVHDVGQPHGMVEKLFDDDGYGFIRTVEDDRQFYFHRNSVLHDDFERLSIGTEVRFTPELGEKGPQATSVQVVAKPGE
ncbi:MAG TPA: HPF/RaiA family ribosome-associated protein [Burkholderiales bacterium]|nr:HPF/RaiA family ribosome-associated protein [Burkholderiales bacterium]